MVWGGGKVLIPRENTSGGETCRRRETEWIQTKSSRWRKQTNKQKNCLYVAEWRRRRLTAGVSCLERRAAVNKPQLAVNWICFFNHSAPSIHVRRACVGGKAAGCRNQDTEIGIGGWQSVGPRRRQECCTSGSPADL